MPLGSDAEDQSAAAAATGAAATGAAATGTDFLSHLLLVLNDPETAPVPSYDVVCQRCCAAYLPCKPSWISGQNENYFCERFGHGAKLQPHVNVLY